MDEQLIGSYKVLKKIGAGGMGKVYLAVHQDVPNLKVILKILGDPSMAGRFRQEADKLALLDGHPNICRIKHFFNHGDDTVIAMEYIDGVTLDERIKSGERMPVSEALPIIICLLDVLQFAHERDVFHRDIKPSNIMIDRQGQVKVIDFGIAKGKTDPNLTITGSSCGTPAYMAPEQFVPTADTDYSKADIYAAGTTLYNLLTGELPFKGGNEFAMRDAKLFSEPVKPRSLNSEISKPLEAIILKSLEKEPSARFESAGAMKKALESLNSHLPQPDVKREPVVDRGDSGKPSKLPKIVVGLVVIVGLATGGYLMFKPKPHTLPKLSAIGNQTVKSGQRISFQVAAVSDDGTVPLVKADNLPEGAQFTASTRKFEWTPTGEQAGAHTVKFAGSNPSAPELRDSLLVTFTVISEDTIAMKPGTAAHLPTGVLQLGVEPYGDIYVDDKLVRKHATTASLPEDDGQYVVTIRNALGQPPMLSETLAVRAGQTTARTFSFTIPTTSKAGNPVYGKLRVTSVPSGATVEIDGVTQDNQTPFTFEGLSEGSHTVKASIMRNGAVKERTQTVQIAPGSVCPVSFDFTN